MGCRFFIARMTSRSLNTVLPGDIDVAYLDLGTFVDFERDFERRRRNAAYLRVHAGRQVTVLGQQLDEHVLGALNFVGIVLRLDHQADLPILVTVQDVGDADGLVAFVLDGAHHRPLHHHETNDPAFLARLALDADIVETAAVPERHEVAVQAVFVDTGRLFCVKIRACKVSWRTRRAPRNSMASMIFSGGWPGPGSSGNRRRVEERAALVVGPAAAVAARAWQAPTGALRHGFERIGRFRRAVAVAAADSEPRLAERQCRAGKQQSRAQRLAGGQACETSSRRVPFHSALVSSTFFAKTFLAESSFIAESNFMAGTAQSPGRVPSQA